VTGKWTKKNNFSIKFLVQIKKIEKETGVLSIVLYIYIFIIKKFLPPFLRKKN